jgi:hypothetical protein
MKIQVHRYCPLLVESNCVAPAVAAVAVGDELVADNSSGNVSATASSMDFIIVS